MAETLNPVAWTPEAAAHIAEATRRVLNMPEPAKEGESQRRMQYKETLALEITGAGTLGDGWYTAKEKVLDGDVWIDAPQNRIDTDEVYEVNGVLGVPTGYVGLAVVYFDATGTQGESPCFHYVKNQHPFRGTYDVPTDTLSIGADRALASDIFTVYDSEGQATHSIVKATAEDIVIAATGYVYYEVENDDAGWTATLKFSATWGPGTDPDKMWVLVGHVTFAGGEITQWFQMLHDCPTIWQREIVPTFGGIYVTVGGVDKVRILAGTCYAMNGTQAVAQADFALSSVTYIWVEWIATAGTTAVSINAALQSGGAYTGYVTDVTSTVTGRVLIGEINSDGEYIPHHKGDIHLWNLYQPSFETDIQGSAGQASVVLPAVKELENAGESTVGAEYFYEGRKTDWEWITGNLKNNTETAGAGGLIKIGGLTQATDTQDLLNQVSRSGTVATWEKTQREWEHDRGLVQENKYTAQSPVTIDIRDWLAAITGYDAGTDQVIENTSGTMQWIATPGGGGGLTISGSDNQIVRLHGSNAIQNSLPTIDDNGAMTIYGPGNTKYLRLIRSAGASTSAYFWLTDNTDSILNLTMTATGGVSRTNQLNQVSAGLLEVRFDSSYTDVDFYGGEFNFRDTVNIGAWGDVEDFIVWGSGASAGVQLASDSGAASYSRLYPTDQGTQSRHNFSIDFNNGAYLSTKTWTLQARATETYYIHDAAHTGVYFQGTSATYNFDGDVKTSGDFYSNSLQGVTTTFTNGDGDTVTVTGGIITDVST